MNLTQKTRVKLMCKLLGPATALAAVTKDQSSWAVLDPGDAIGTIVIGTWGIRFGINPTRLCCAEGVGIVCVF